MIELKTCKYKGVEFLFESMPTTGGNRLIKFNYPGSDKQSIERQGKAPRSFSITAIIPHDNYYQKRDELLRVLEDGETGVLTHPTFGDIDNIINGIYTLTEIISELGRAKITIPFEVDDSVGIPEQSGNLISQVQTLNNNFVSQTLIDIEGYNVTTNFPGNFSDAVNNIDNIADAFISAIQLADAIIERAADFRVLIVSFRSIIGDMIASPTLLGEKILGLFESVNSLFEEPAQTIIALNDLFTFGEDDPFINTTTASRIERKNNRDILRANIRSQALSYSYLNAPQINFNNSDALDLVETELETEYGDIRNNQLMTNESLEDMDRLRVQTQKTLDTVRINSKAIITVETKKMPLSIFVYSYYGNTDLISTIAELNNVNQNAFIEGNIRILTA